MLNWLKRSWKKLAVVCSALLGIAALVLAWIAYSWWTLLGLTPLVLLVVFWTVKTIGTVDKDEVALRSWFGKVEKRIFPSGVCLVPWLFDIRFNGRTLCELVRIPTKQLPFNFEGKVEQRIWSKDRQLLLVDISGYVRFPYNEVDSLYLMVKSGVPTEERAFQDWMQQETVAGLRDILAGFNHDEAIGKSNLAAIREATRDFFLSPSGLFAKSGICGNDLLSFTEGSGEVIVRVDSINPTTELQKAMEKPVVARYEAQAAKETAKREAEEVGGQVLGIVARQHGMTVEDLEELLEASPDIRGTSVSESGLKETFEWAQAQTTRDRAEEGLTYDESKIDISSGGQPLKDSNLGAVIGGIAAAVSQIGRGGRRRRNRQNPPGNPSGNPGGQGGGQQADDGSQYL